MDINGIRGALGVRPFQPFVIRLADGRGLPVPHPDFVAVGSRRILVIAPDDSWAVVEPFLVVSLDYESARPASSNGDEVR
jgi:hypothetical protein